ncbi:MAG: hypothetical protein AAGA57_05525 [Planctomycetota bacterium]
MPPTPAPDPAPDADPPPGLAVRRATDRCFFAVEEIVHDPQGRLEGYVVEGFLIPADEVAEVRTHAPACGPDAEPHP